LNCAPCCIARLDAGECMRSMTEARARELEGLGHQ
jgi:hypothetical protein